MQAPRYSARPFFGSPTHVHEVAGLRLTEGVYAKDLRTPKHTHSRAYFCFMLKGTSTQTSGSVLRVRKPFDTVFYPPHEMQAERFDSEGRVFSVELDDAWLRRFREYGVIKERSVVAAKGTLTPLIGRLYREFRLIDHASSLTIEGLTLELIAQVARANRRSLDQMPRWLHQVREILHAEFTERVTISRIADRAGVHPVYLASTFRKNFHCSVGDYVRQLRIDLACRELAQEDHALAEISHACGFASQAHFSKTFKRVVGMTPREYRVQARYTFIPTKSFQS